MRIRRGNVDDARGILEMHRRSVQGLAAEDYDDEVLEAWSPPIDDDRVDAFVEKVFGDDATAEVFVAVEGGGGEEGRIVGFSAVEPDEERLWAVYVDPDYARSGLGTALLRQAEWAAAQEGAERLELEASVNAEDFYVDQEYRAVERRELSLEEGIEMECVAMEKELPGPGL